MKGFHLALAGLLLFASSVLAPAVDASAATATVSPTTITIGQTGVLAVADSDNGNLSVAQEATLSQAATINSLSFYVTQAAGELLLGIYDASGKGGRPGKLLAETKKFTTVKGWNTQNVITPVSLPAGTYWLAYLPNNNGLGFVKQNNSGNCYYYSHSFANGLAASFSASPKNCTPTTWSFYAILTTSSGSDGGGSPTPVNGVCSAVSGTAVSSAPTTDLCSTGTASSVTGSGPWAWTCAGSARLALRRQLSMAAAVRRVAPHKIPHRQPISAARVRL